MNRLVGHHEALADFSLGTGAHLRGSVLDFADDEASSVPVGQERDRGRKKRRKKRKMGKMLVGQNSKTDSYKWWTARSLLINLLVRAALVHGEVRFDLEVDATSLKIHNKHVWKPTEATIRDIEIQRGEVLVYLPLVVRPRLQRHWARQIFGNLKRRRRTFTAEHKSYFHLRFKEFISEFRRVHCEPFLSKHPVCGFKYSWESHFVYLRTTRCFILLRVLWADCVMDLVFWLKPNKTTYYIEGEDVPNPAVPSIWFNLW